jgi:hypothetical protein
MEKQIIKLYKIKKFRLGDVLKNHENILDYGEHDYDWNTLARQLETDGYAPQKYKTYIELEDVSHDQGYKENINILDGNHRIRMMLKLFGEDYVFKAKVEEINLVNGKDFNKPKKEDKSCPHCYEPLKGCDCKLAKAEDGFTVHKKCLDEYNMFRKKEKENLLNILKQKFENEPQ